MTLSKYPQDHLHIKTHKYIVSKLRAKADKNKMPFGAYMTEFLIQALENEKIVNKLNEGA